MEKPEKHGLVHNGKARKTRSCSAGGFWKPPEGAATVSPRPAGVLSRNIAFRHRILLFVMPFFSLYSRQSFRCDGKQLNDAMRWDGWRGQLEQLLGGADGGGSRARHAEHARLGLETAFREDARALRARLHPFGRSRLELGYQCVKQRPF